MRLVIGGRAGGQHVCFQRFERRLQHVFLPNDDALAKKLDGIFIRTRVEENFGSLVSSRVMMSIKTMSYANNFQFRLHAGADVNLARRISAGYRFQHMSNANTFETNPGLNLHMVEFAYRF
nr:acyloxyacyl hydrolase [Gammaproteobacteria bacterium]